MSRASKWTLAVLVLFILGIGLYAGYQPGGDLRAECTQSFSRLDAGNNNQMLEYDEFLAYREGVTEEEFARADTDANKTLTVQEFCNWAGAGTERG